MIDNFIVSPSDLLLNIMETQKINVSDIAAKTNIPIGIINQLLIDEILITKQVAQQLSALKNSSDEWIKTSKFYQSNKPIFW